MWQKLATWAGALNWSSLLRNLLAAFLTPVAVAIARGTDVHAAAWLGLGLALTAFINFIQTPGTTGKDKPDEPPRA